MNCGKALAVATQKQLPPPDCYPFDAGVRLSGLPIAAAGSSAAGAAALRLSGFPIAAVSACIGADADAARLSGLPIAAGGAGFTNFRLSGFPSRGIEAPSRYGRANCDQRDFL